MSARKLVTAALLAFVAISVAFLAQRNVRAAKDSRAAAAAESTPLPAAAQAPVSGPGRVIAYYFYVTVRCTTCRAIEAYSREAIFDRFKPELATGRLEWRPVNVQLPENRHFIQDYQLFTRSLVLVREQNGRQQEYKVLHDTWELVGDKRALQGYVEQEVRGYLRKLG